MGAIEIATRTIDISPKLPLEIYNFQTAKTVHDTLEANIQIFKEESHWIVIITIDTLFSSKSLENRIIHILYEQGISHPVNLLTCASHTHFAPMLDDTKPNLGILQADHFNEVAQKIAAAILDLITQLRPLRNYTYKVGASDLGTYRRRQGWSRKGLLLKKTTLMLPDPTREIDKKIHLVEFFDQSNKLCSVGWSFACHPVCFPLKNTISADFPGYIRKRLRAYYENPELPILFLQGFSGNIRPWNFGEAPKQNAGIKGAIWNLVNAPVFPSFTMNSWLEWCESLWRDVAKTIERSPVQFKADNISLQQIKVPIGLFFKGDSRTQEMEIVSLMIGSKLKFVGFGGEICNEYVRAIERSAIGSIVIPIGCVGQVFGYLPTQQMALEGGYEVDGFQETFHMKGVFHTDVEEVIKNQLLKMAP